MADQSQLPRRIIKETQRLLSEPAPGISATPYSDNLRYFNVIISGPETSPYQGGIFKLELFLPEDYPMAPPKVRFLTKIYHPNIDRLGRICLDILKDKWSPALQIRTVLLSIQALLSAPNPDDPLANDVAEAWKQNEENAHKTGAAALWSKREARGRGASAVRVRDGVSWTYSSCRAGICCHGLSTQEILVHTRPHVHITDLPWVSPLALAAQEWTRTHAQASNV
eukprot:CAMPEP_0174701656 /NCGR_PEP_ID=MMETSP1094-20130205/6223_1 /TAXON_ID=156173 /ORGANISM="Chrysochromulina brevifilum, Strain UTEX LB 985" /LENGTH=224 /DNA_ID=CAMNT_0015899333 /DNA_START=27 /DNA_END=701 /DNA_ORIENTATION=-